MLRGWEVLVMVVAARSNSMSHSRKGNRANIMQANQTHNSTLAARDKTQLRSFYNVASGITDAVRSQLAKG